MKKTTAVFTETITKTYEIDIEFLTYEKLSEILECVEKSKRFETSELVNVEVSEIKYSHIKNTEEI